jgi:hypothetical protein
MFGQGEDSLQLLHIPQAEAPQIDQRLVGLSRYDVRDEHLADRLAEEGAL